VTTEGAVLPVSVDSVTKRYGTGVWANREISLDVYTGEVVGILGPNGAGQTTLVRQTTDELFPTKESIRVFGHDVVRDLATAESLMGVVPQEAQLSQRREPPQNIPKLHGLPRREASRRADEIIDQMRLTDHRQVLADKLSGGLCRRLLVGIPAVTTPLLLVLDEQKKGLDPLARQDLWTLIRQCRESGSRRSC
jgi:ABC-2 type transport system ATP-binding protein